MIRRIDDLGKVAIPQVLRRTLDIKAGDQLSLSIEDSKISIQKHGDRCVHCHSITIDEKNEGALCKDCSETGAGC